MNSTSVAVVAGARPNFMKIAPVLKALDAHGGFCSTLIHTGQHYDSNLSDVFFDELRIRQPDVRLSISGVTHATQTAQILAGTEAVFAKGDTNGRPFDFVVVVGDVNSTMAATIAAAKLQIPVAHIEAGLRSGDRSMPEEINRLITDSVSDLLFASEPAAVSNLKREGHPDHRVFLVGNVMIDTLMEFLPKARSLSTLSEFRLESGKYATVTLHRPSNVDNAKVLSGIVDVLIRISRRIPVLFPLHPRTKSRLEAFGLLERMESESGIRIAEPLGYMSFLCLNAQAKVLITDSGGLQEESTALGVPCLTLRANTERPVTVEQGTSTLIGNDAELLEAELENVLAGKYKVGRCPELWDGKAAERIVQVLAAGTDCISTRRELS